jgi:hypothetical protein
MADAFPFLFHMVSPPQARGTPPPIWTARPGGKRRGKTHVEDECRTRSAMRCHDRGVDL